MNFFEKARARAHAQEVLGLMGHPDPNEIRAAYKKLARAKHPDRCERTHDEFTRINVAYSLLKKDNGYTAADMLHPTPTDVGATTFRPNARRPDSVPVSDISGDNDNIAGAYVAPRRVRAAMTSRIIKINQSDFGECRTLLDEIPFMAEPDPDEISLRANILNAVKDIEAPYVPHTNHLP